MSLRLFHQHEYDKATDHSENGTNPTQNQDNDADLDEAPSNTWLFVCAACLFVLWRASIVD